MRLAHIPGELIPLPLSGSIPPREFRSRMTRCRRAASSMLSPASCKSCRPPDQGIRLGVAEESPGSGQLPQTGPPRLLQLNATSLSQLRRDHETGHLAHKIANASK